MSAASPARLGYRPALDGLRAVAVSLVLATHAHPSILKGGELGVDIFFALSGFLITTLILEELGRGDGAGSYRFVHFYMRRALRLFPALYAMVLVSGLYLAVRWGDLPGYLEQTGIADDVGRGDYPRFLLAAATYTTNIIGVTQTPGNFLGHTWSLAVEEQFYLLWPIILVTAFRRRLLRPLAVVLGVLVVAGVGSRLAGVDNTAGILWNRPEAIVAGALAGLARWTQPGLRALVVRWSAPVGTVGLAVLVVVAVARSRVFELDLARTAWLPVYAVVAAVTVWALAESEPSPATRLLSLRPVVYVGLISYGLYVWHVPVFRMVTWELSASGTVNIIVKVALSVAVAALSYRFVERPFRRMQRRYRTVGTEAAVMVSEPQATGSVGG